MHRTSHPLLPLTTLHYVARSYINAILIYITVAIDCVTLLDIKVTCCIHEVIDLHFITVLR